MAEVTKKKCRECREGALVDAPGVYQYRSLPSVTLTGVRRRICDHCGAEFVSIPAMGKLNQLLAEMLVRKPAPLTGDEIRFLRKHQGWTAKDLASVMGVTPESVSRWENGARQMASSADRLLRLLVAHAAGIRDYSAFDVFSSIDDTVLGPAPLRLDSGGDGWTLAA